MGNKDRRKRRNISEKNCPVSSKTGLRPVANQDRPGDRWQGSPQADENKKTAVPAHSMKHAPAKRPKNGPCFMFWQTRVNFGKKSDLRHSWTTQQRPPPLLKKNFRFLTVDFRPRSSPTPCLGRPMAPRAVLKGRSFPRKNPAPHGPPCRWPPGSSGGCMFAG